MISLSVGVITELVLHLIWIGHRGCIDIGNGRMFIEEVSKSLVHFGNPGILPTSSVLMRKLYASPRFWSTQDEGVAITNFFDFPDVCETK